MGRHRGSAALLRRGAAPRPAEPAGPLQQGQLARAAHALRGRAALLRRRLPAGAVGRPSPYYNRALCQLVLEQPGAGRDLAPPLSQPCARRRRPARTRRGGSCAESSRASSSAWRGARAPEAGRAPPRRGDGRGRRRPAATRAVDHSAMRRPRVASPAASARSESPARPRVRTAPHPPRRPRRPLLRRRRRRSGPPGPGPRSAPTTTQCNDEAAATSRPAASPRRVAASERSLDLDPWNATALGNRANALFKLGKVDEAIAGSRAGPGLAPLLHPSWASKAAIEQMSGRRAEALGSYREVLGQRRHPDTRSSSTKRKSRCEGSRRPESKAPPRSALGWLGRGLQLGAAGRFAGIDRRPRARRLRRDPNLIEGWLMKAEALRRTRRPEQADAALVEAAHAANPTIPRSGTRRASASGASGATRRRWQHYDRALAQGAAVRRRLERPRQVAGRPEAARRGHRVAGKGHRPRSRGAPRPGSTRPSPRKRRDRPADALHSYAMFLERSQPEHSRPDRDAKDRIAILRAARRERAACDAPPRRHRRPARATPPPPPAAPAPADASAAGALGPRGPPARAASRRPRHLQASRGRLRAPTPPTGRTSACAMAGSAPRRGLAAYDRALALDPRYVAALTNKAALVRQRAATTRRRAASTSS